MAKKPDPLKPSASLLCKLGSIIVHYDEFHGPSGNDVDKTAAEAALKDADVQEWLAQMQTLSMVPLKRN